MDSGKNNKPERADGSSHGIFADRGEHTLGGTVIGMMRDAVSRGGTEPGFAARDRAAQNDRIAEIAADTVAFLPSMKWYGAGAFKAVFTADVHGPATAGSFGHFAKNFLEGAALNKVGKLGAPEGFLARNVTSKLGQGLAAETVNHLAVGFGMGAVKTGFNPGAWKDKSGQLSLSRGLENTLISGGFGAVVNVPAGMVGIRISKAATVGLADGLLPRTAAGLMSGFGSGYAAGSVFGGIDAIVAGKKSLPDILSQMGEGGLAGGLSGAFIHGYESRRWMTSSPEAVSPGSVRSKLPQLDQAQRTSPAAAERTSPAAVERQLPAAEDRIAPTDKAAAHGSEHESEADLFNRLDFLPKHDRLVDLSRRLHFTKEVHPLAALRSSRPAENVEFRDLSHYTSVALETQNTPVRVYGIDGLPTKIVVPETYAQKLDAVRQLRLNAEQSGTTGARDQMMQTYKARADLRADAYGDRMLPEELIPYIEALPNRSLVKQVLLVDYKNPYDPWFAQRYQQKDFESSASANGDRTITLYQKKRDNPGTEWVTREDVGHEWAHLQKFADKHGSNSFNVAAELESEGRGGYFYNDYSHTKPKSDAPHDENWAVHLGQNFLHPDADHFVAVAKEMPIRSAVMGRSLAKALKDVPFEQRSPHHYELEDRVEYVEKYIVPEAKDRLLDHLAAKDPFEQAKAVRLLRDFGDHTDVPALKAVARSSSAKALGLMAYHTALDLTPTEPQKMSLLLDLSKPGSTVREYAVQNLKNRSKAYGDYAEWYGDPVKANAMVSLIDRMPDSQGRQMVIDEIVRLSVQSKSTTPLYSLIQKPDINAQARTTAFDAAISILKTNPDQQVALSLNALLLHPELRLKALDVLKHYPEPEVARRVEKFVDDSDPKVAQRAQDVLASWHLDNSVAKYSAQLESGSPTQKSAAITELARIDAAAMKNGGVGDRRAIEAMLKTGARGDESLRLQVRKALSSHSIELLKFEARQLMSTDPTLTAGLRELLRYRAQDGSV